MSTPIESALAAIKAIRAITLPGVTLCLMGGRACVQVDYHEAEISDPDQLEPIYKCIEEALNPHGCSVREGTLDDGIEGIEINWPAGLEPTECDGYVALYQSRGVELGNYQRDVAFFAWGLCIGSSDVRDIGRRAKIRWAADQDALNNKNRAANDFSDCADWDSPEAIEITD